MEILLLIFVSVVLVGCVVYQDKQYKKTAYYQVTKNPYSSVKYNKGMYGEYYAYKRLQALEEGGSKFLFNLYIPRGNEKTTEIDMLLVCSKGLIVFESKNYSGWIFGNEKNKNWTQTFPAGRGRSHRERFYNPIMQNATHIKHLRRIVGDNIPIYSIIVFSDHCTLKDVSVYSDVQVVQGYEIFSVVNRLLNQKPDCLGEMQITQLYIKLYPYSQVGSEVKEKHVEVNGL
ncbi:MAG: nuclease-related domain-containing protein [Micavibrio sp.]